MVPGLYGAPSLRELVKAQQRKELEGGFQTSTDEEDETALPAIGDERIVATLKRKRQAVLLKSMLKDGGYGDLAKMISLHSERG